MAQNPLPEDSLPAPGKPANSEPAADRLFAEEAAQGDAAAPARGALPGDDLPTALLRLLVGGALEGGEQISARLRQWQAESAAIPAAPAQAGELRGQAALRSLVVGALFGANRSARRRLDAARSLAHSAASASFSLLQPLSRLAPLQPLKRGFERLAQRGQAEVEEWVRQGQLEEMHSRRMLRRTVSGSLGEAIHLLAGSEQASSQVHELVKAQIGALAAGLPHSPEVDALVQKLVNQVVGYIQAHPEELEGLVRSQGDLYLDHLSENPAQVQDIVQGQSTSLADEMSDEVRERMVTADNVFELFVRSLLRRPLREELPPPKSEIRQRALRARLREEAPGAEPPNHFHKGS